MDHAPSPASRCTHPRLGPPGDASPDVTPSGFPAPSRQLWNPASRRFDKVRLRSYPGDPDGRDVSGEDVVPGADPQYRGLKGLWKDTIRVESLIVKPADQDDPKQKYTVVVRTRYERYIGDFVLHHHILDREDQGMMQNVRIELPNRLGGTSHGHH